MTTISKITTATIAIALGVIAVVVLTGGSLHQSQSANSTPPQTQQGNQVTGTQPPSPITLTNWKLTLPDANATEITAEQLQAGYQSQYFTKDASGALHFSCPVTGGTTPNAKFPRSELREQLTPADDTTNWPLSGTHTLEAVATITKAPSTGKIIVGQIHGYDARPLVKLQWENGRLAALVKHLATGSNKDQKYWFANQQSAFPLNQQFHYRITVTDETLTVQVNDETIQHHITAEDSGWQDLTYYFKAGAYCQDNQGPPTETADVTFHQLALRHSPQ